MAEIASLKGEQDFLRITDGEAVCYGGDQAWFDFTVGRYGGCGTVAAADLTAYLAFSVPGGKLHSLYGPEIRRKCGNLSKKDYLAHMNTLYRYVTPWKVPFVRPDRPAKRHFGWTFGVWPAGRLIRGIRRYAAEHGVTLRGEKISSRKPLSDLVDFIRDSLRRDCPVAMLIGKRPRYEREMVVRSDGFCWEQTHFAYHWVLITKLAKRNGRIMVKVSTWGGYSWLDLEAWHEAGGLIPALVTFRWDTQAD